MRNGRWNVSVFCWLRFKKTVNSVSLVTIAPLDPPCNCRFALDQKPFGAARCLRFGDGRGTLAGCKCSYWKGRLVRCGRSILQQALGTLNWLQEIPHELLP